MCGWVQTSMTSRLKSVESRSDSLGARDLTAWEAKSLAPRRPLSVRQKAEGWEAGHTLWAIKHIL